MDPVIHFEIPAKDTARIRTFYESAFGWQTAPFSEDMGNFVLAFTIETDENTRMPQKAGAINGGFHLATQQAEHVKLTILVEDIRAAKQKIEAAGGQVLGEPFELPGVGLFVATSNQDFTIKRL